MKDRIQILDSFNDLKVTQYRNGDSIPEAISNEQWVEFGEKKIGCYSINDNGNYLYNWYAVDDSRNIAPEGWHVPTDDEWQTLIDHLGGSSVAGDKMKETGTSHWNSPNTGATNESGFTALPAGYRDDNGNYYYMGFYDFFWSATENYSGSAWGRILYGNYSGVYRINYYKKYGFIVRYIKDVIEGEIK